MDCHLLSGSFYVVDCPGIGSGFSGVLLRSFTASCSVFVLAVYPAFRSAFLTAGRPLPEGTWS